MSLQTKWEIYIRRHDSAPSLYLCLQNFQDTVRRAGYRTSLNQYKLTMKHLLIIYLPALIFFACSKTNNKIPPAVIPGETSDQLYMNGQSYAMDRSPLSDFPRYQDIFRPDTVLTVHPGPKFDKYYIVQWRLHHDSIYLQAVDYDRRIAITTKKTSVLYPLIEKLTGRTFDASGRIFADWVNGCYRVKLPDTPIPPQEMPPLKNESRHWSMRQYVELTFRNGRLVSRKTFDPATGRTTNEECDQDSTHPSNIVL